MKDSVLKSSRTALDRRLNSPVGFRALLSVFLIVAIVFSAVPLLRYFRGRRFITVMPSRGMRTAGSDAIEFALLILLILMLPFAVLIQRLLGGESSSLRWWSVPALAILALALPFPRGAQTYSNIFFTTLLLFIGLSIELLRCKQQTQEIAVRSIS